MKNLWFVLLCLPIFACAPASKPDTTVDLSKKKELLRKNMAAFSEALMKEDYDFVVNAYTEDAKIFPGGTKILAGKEAIRNYWTPPAGSNRKMTYHKIIPEEIKIIGKEAYDYGYYEGKSTNGDGQESSFKGKYVITWKEVAPDDWKMYLDIWNGVRE